MSTNEDNEEYTAFVRNFRHWSNPRRYVPIVWWDGHSWNMSVRDHHNEHHTKCASSWNEIKTYAEAWAHLNKAHGLRVDASHELAA